MKLLFGFLLLLSVGLFAFMQWGGILTHTSQNEQTLGELNPDKIKSLALPQLTQFASSALAMASPVNAASSTLVESAPHAHSAPAVIPETVPDARPIVLPITPISSPAPPLPAVLSKVKAIKVCMEWAEFSGSDLERANRQLDELKMGTRLSQRTVEYDSGFWVYIPPLANKTAVNIKIEQLKARGVEDYFVVQGPAIWLNSISLGVFKTRKAALNFQSNLKKKDVRTAKVIERKHKLKYIVFMLKGLDVPTQKRLLVLQKDFPASELTTISCHY